MVDQHPETDWEQDGLGGKWYQPGVLSGAGWWRASDGRWYRPEDRPATPQQPVPAALADDAPRVLTAKGVTGRLSVDDHYITIRRKGAMAKATHGFTKGEKRIRIDTVTAVQFKKPGVTNGYIQFTLGGGTEGTRGVMQATTDENTVVFNSLHTKEFVAVREHVEHRIVHGVVPAQPLVIQQQGSVAAELRDLAALRDQGILTEAEFQRQKSRLLG